MTSELEEKKRARGLHQSTDSFSEEIDQPIEDNINEFLDLAPSETFRKLLQQRLQAVTIR